MLKHLENVGDVLTEALQVRECISRVDNDGFNVSHPPHPLFLCQYADIVDMMVQGPESELEKLKGSLASFDPAYYPLVAGSLRSRSARN